MSVRGRTSAECREVTSVAPRMRRWALRPPWCEGWVPSSVEHGSPGVTTGFPRTSCAAPVPKLLERGRRPSAAGCRWRGVGPCGAAGACVATLLRRAHGCDPKGMQKRLRRATKWAAGPRLGGQTEAWGGADALFTRPAELFSSARTAFLLIATENVISLTCMRPSVEGSHEKETTWRRRGISEQCRSSQCA